MTHTTVLVGSQKEKKQALGILEAAFPKEMGEDKVFGTRWLDLDVKTVDEYIGGIAEAESRRSKDDVLPQLDLRKLRSDVLADKGDHEVVVYRYVQDPGESPLKRRYTQGEALQYEITGTHTMQGKVTSDYFGHAAVSVKKSTDGVFYEEIQWTQARDDGKDAAASPNARQSLSLDPKFRGGFPDLSKIDRDYFAQILDLMTFYVDDQLAIKKGLWKEGDHAYVKHGTPNSWADGVHVVTGYDCIDFDITLIEVDLPHNTANLRVRHVPPEQGCGPVPAEWMRKPASDTANNWFEVEKQGAKKYVAGAGKEVFDAEITVSMPSGVIKSATMYNPVDIEQRTCKDAALSECGDPEKIRIVRRINLALVQ